MLFNINVQIPTKKIDFRIKYKENPDELMKDEARGLYPPRFIFNLCRKSKPCSHLTVKFEIHLKEGNEHRGKFIGNVFIEHTGNLYT